MPLIPIHSVREAVAHLKAGDLVIYPTETAYALGVDPCQPRAIKKIFFVKGRQHTKALPLVAASATMVAKFCIIPLEAMPLLHRYWPGPLTLVLQPRRKSFLSAVRGGQPTLAIRVSSEPLARSMSQKLGRPVLATSANRSGEQNCYSLKALKQSLGRTTWPIYVVAKGTLPRRRPSTIVAFVRGSMQVIRSGTIHPPLI